MTSSASRPALRKQLRQARRALSRAQQHKAAERLKRQLAQDIRFLRARHIAFYLANDGEIDPARLLQLANRYRKHCYLPVLQRWPATGMAFQRLIKGQRWQRNRFGICEPRTDRRRQVKAWRLQLVLLPLVGFDSAGNRLGMGGGFYDRAFAYRRRQRHTVRPRLLGLAHQCQQVPQLPFAGWDVPLDGVITDRGCY
ncbi:5-formyltetrahydrofolate cyclo-ligase [Halopseudomonas oceani]|uniref:5-formyltetrahydrofolate cyclo-ligase n=1 Tax=Halopseudomonas oceani TaxID=1708783 RepID=UPI002AA76E46|nr:5-formyltetrahydrofolate cyclo-ligase [Halopseudomonas oceani]